MWRNIASNAITFFVVAAFLLAGLILWGQREYAAQGPLEEAICLRVERGATMREISRKLEERGAIASGAMFRIGADYTGKDSKLKAGSWLIPEGSSMAEVTDRITRGGQSTCGTEVVYRVGVRGTEARVRKLDPATREYEVAAAFDPDGKDPPEAFRTVVEQVDTRYRVAVAEGVTSWRIVQALEDVEVLDGELNEVPDEGSLAPDSYEVRAGDTRASVIARMQEAQEVILAAAWEDRAEDLPIDTPEEALILASIIEKETGVPEERRQVASVFVNRLRVGMKLQTDPTVIYGITEGRGVLGRGLRQSELRAPTPWNTYVNFGLPPTPIANPGRASIEAAVDPAETDYRYFVADGSGGHAFARTLAEHNANVARWREIEAERQAD
ncbi:endolytic transglycosylase MltG [Roseovarius salinarum]|uniref:endolytic transglycosylase MltG n=1 Tax=Roseovarius salinarum TaxID=1981892 RepID=UPI000C31D73C|nr:endolytic transglycosylase MltG [Roseovarius salinarum]